MTSTQLQYSPQVATSLPDLQLHLHRGPTYLPAPRALREFKQKLQMRTDLLSYFKRDISRACGVLNEERFYSNRACFLIDKEGRVRWSHIEAKNGERRDNSEILAAIKLLS